MSEYPFKPDWANTTSVTNAVAATAAVAIPKDCYQVVLTNTSETARVHVMMTNYAQEGNLPTGTAPTTTTGLPVMPGSQIRVSVGIGYKLLRTIATAADGLLLITPGNGD